MAPTGLWARGEGQNRPVMSASSLSEVPHGTHWPVGEGGGSEQTSDVRLRLVRGTAWHPLACGGGGGSEAGSRSEHVSWDETIHFLWVDEKRKMYSSAGVSNCSLMH